MRFDAIIVPRGAEAGAVERGWPAARPAMVTVPAGRAAARDLVSGPSIATALVLGLCGALDPALHVGDTVIYDRVHDGSVQIELDPLLVAACAAACARTPVTAAAVDHFVGARSAKRALRELTGAAVVDMEAGAIAAALHRHGVRVAMVRIVSDAASSDLPELVAIYDADGKLRPLALGLALARTPRRSARFVADALSALRALRKTATRLSLSAP